MLLVVIVPAIMIWDSLSWISGVKLISRPESWREIAAAKRAAILDKIPEEWRLQQTTIQAITHETRLTGQVIEDLLDAQTLEITSLDTCQILERVANGTYSSYEVTRAFCERASYAHQINDNVLDFLIEPALQQAAELDQYLTTHGHVIGPLHGLPFSMKDQFHVVGAETTMGYVGWVGTFEGQTGTGQEGLFESELVRQMKVLGAIPIAKTSPTQTLGYPETQNNILGYNWNPWNKNLSSGGSSGGQGALQALKGTTLGIASDNGGSVSMPAAFNGLYSIKPSNGRLSFKGVPDSQPELTMGVTVPGLIADSISGLIVAFEALIRAEPWRHDTAVVPLTWKGSQLADTFSPKQQLRIGVLYDDGQVRPHPPVERALRIVEGALHASGHRTVAWKPPAIHNGSDALEDMLDAERLQYAEEQIRLSREPLIPQLKDEFQRKRHSPPKLLQIYKWTAILHTYRTAFHEYWGKSAARGSAEDKQQYSIDSKELFEDTRDDVDAVILPVAPHAAVLPDKFYYYAYSMLANVLDAPAVVVPITTADARLDHAEGNYEPRNEVDKKNWIAYDPELYHGAPVAVQILGKRLQEEALLNIARTVVAALSLSGDAKSHNPP